MEKGGETEIHEFLRLVWVNPKHLVTSCDTPEIYHYGYRRNLLHCAADWGNLPLCQAIMDTISYDLYWSTLHPLDSEEKREKDKLKVIDLYLNMQDGTVTEVCCCHGYRCY